MAVSTKPKNFTNVEITFLDGAGSPTSLVMVGVMDNLAVAGLKKHPNAVTWHQSRGKPTGKSYSNFEPITLSFGFEVRELSDAAPGAIPDWVLKQNAYASLVSKSGTGTEDVWSWDVQIKIYGATEHGDSDDHEFTVRNVHATGFDYADADPCTFTFAGEGESSDGDIITAILGS